MSVGKDLEGDGLQLEIFRRKYLQMLDPGDINYPMEWFIKSPETQKWIYDHMFSAENFTILPYPPYAYRILKRLMSILEAAMEDPEEDEISDDLANCFAEMVAKKAKSSIESSQEKRPVTYTGPVLSSDPPTVTILEAPNLLASNGDTGHRTWDAALFLATFLFTDGRHFIQDASVLELGAGLGFVSVLCGKHLGARRVLMTDASETILCAAQQNAELNGVDSIVRSSVLEWGTRDVDRVHQNDGEAISYDLVLGADMLYEPRDFPALMSTLEDLFTHNPKIQMLISTAIRREETLESFMDACNEHSLHVERVRVALPPEKEQLGFFHSSFYEIHIYLITKRRRLMTDGRAFLDLMLSNKGTSTGSNGYMPVTPDYLT
ncbi:MAG: hypothetical protein Q9168_004003 [Polycauliona sp. 1 TL-2023]